MKAQAIIIIMLITTFNLLFFYRVQQAYQSEDSDSANVFSVKAIIDIGKSFNFEFARIYLMDVDNDGALEIVVYEPSLLSDLALAIYDYNGTEFIKKSIEIPFDISGNNKFSIKGAIEWHLAATLVDVDQNGENDLIITVYILIHLRSPKVEDLLLLGMMSLGIMLTVLLTSRICSSIFWASYPNLPAYTARLCL